MKIDGKLLANNLLSQLTQKVKYLQVEKNLTPRMAVVLIGNNPDSLAYIHRKEIAAQKIGALFSLHQFRPETKPSTIISVIKRLAKESNIHGLIVQRPVPLPFDTDKLTQIVPIAKDVDGFLPNSPFLPPVGRAVWKILAEIYFRHIRRPPQQLSPIDEPAAEFLVWLKSQVIVLIGRGETAGKPIAHTFISNHIAPIIVHSQTSNPETIVKNADIVISAVGKPKVVSAQIVKRGAVVIGVGLHFENNKLRGDFDDLDIQKVAGFYTPTPGGVGPLNVASLMQNVVTTCKAQI